MSGSGARRFVEVAGAVAWRTTYNYLTTASLLLPTLIFPLFFYAAFAGGLSRVEDAPGFDYANGYTAFVFAFVLLQEFFSNEAWLGALAKHWQLAMGVSIILVALFLPRGLSGLPALFDRRTSQTESGHG